MGFNSGLSGNISVKIEGQRPLIAITPSGKHYSKLSVDDIIVIDDPDDVPRSLYGVLLKGAGGEPFIMPVPFIAVFDDDDFREKHPIDSWNFLDTADPYRGRIEAYTTYLKQNVDRIQFNRYSGVALR